MTEEDGHRDTTPAATNTTVHVGLHSTTPVFDSTQEEWVEYVERLDSYFLANDIWDPAKKRAILVNAVGPQTYQLIKTLCLPGKPQDHSFEEISGRVKTHFHSPIIKRYEFNTRKQKPGETIAEFTAALRKIADDCEFGTVLNDMLRDRLVFGVSDKKLQNRYLRESTLTYVQARDMALAAETADKDSRRLQDTSDACGSTLLYARSQQDETVANVRNSYNCRPRSGRPSSDTSSSSATSSTCYRCGGKHDASKCHFKEYECRHCHKKGHLARVCRKKARDHASEQAHHVEASLSSDEEYTMYTIGSKTTKPFIVNV